MIYYDFSDCELSNKAYGGTERKLGILIDGKPYMLKFRKQTPFGFRNNTISEYLGSHIFSMLGFDCQQTFLGTYCGKQVVACKDFVTDGYLFVPFNDVGESTIEEDREVYQYSYDDIVELLKANKKLTKVDETISSFFSVFVVDALLGNFDRHGGNWGFLKKANRYSLSPIFDNGSCLYPNLTNEDEMKMIMDDQEEIDRRVFKFPTSQIQLNGNKSSYFEVISSLRFEEINKALIDIVPRISLPMIDSLIDDIQAITEVQKRFYKTMIENRYSKILLYSYNKMKDLKDADL